MPSTPMSGGGRLHIDISRRTLRDGGARPSWLADDEELVRKAAAAMLEELGHDVIEASSGSVALKLFDEYHEIELIITDYLMQGRSNFSQSIFVD